MKRTFAATALIAFVSAQGYDQHDHSDFDNEYTGPIAPESFGYAVNDFDIDEPTIDDECYAHQVDIYSD